MPSRLRGSRRAYAQHRRERGLPGGTQRAVQVALLTGRIGGALGEDDQLDFALADRLWVENTNPAMVRPLDYGANGQDAPGAAISGEPDSGVMVSVRDVLAMERRRELALWGFLGAAMREVAPKLARAGQVSPAEVAQLLDNALERAHEMLEAQWRRWYGEPQS